jgi:hypothetical protein
MIWNSEHRLGSKVIFPNLPSRCPALQKRAGNYKGNFQNGQLMPMEK